MSLDITYYKGRWGATLDDKHVTFTAACSGTVKALAAQEGVSVEEVLAEMFALADEYDQVVARARRAAVDLSEVVQKLGHTANRAHAKSYLIEAMRIASDALGGFGA